MRPRTGLSGMFAVRGGRVFGERCAGADGPRQQLALAVRANAAEMFDRAIFAERALERTNHRAGLFRRKIAITALAVRAHL